LTPAISPEKLDALARKYEIIAHLRRERADGGPVAPRAELRALAREFPGSLRELDTVPMALLERRIRALADAARGAGPVEPWMAWMSAYHATMRAALFVKARLARASHVSADLAANLAEAAAAHLGVAVDPLFVRAVASPPRGRLNVVVFDRLAGEFDVPSEAIQKALFPPARAVEK
jgi:hypothetical protein